MLISAPFVGDMSLVDCGADRNTLFRYKADTLDEKLVGVFDTDKNELSVVARGDVFTKEILGYGKYLGLKPFDAGITEPDLFTVPEFQIQGRTVNAHRVLDKKTFEMSYSVNISDKLSIRFESEICYLNDVEIGHLLHGSSVTFNEIYETSEGNLHLIFCVNDGFLGLVFDASTYELQSIHDTGIFFVAESYKKYYISKKDVKQMKREALAEVLADIIVNALIRQC